MSDITSAARRHAPDRLRRRSIMLLILYVGMILFLTMLLIPDTAWATEAASAGVGSGGVSCQNANGSGDTDVYACLPSGRWSRNVGSITARTEPAKGVLGGLSNFMSGIATTVRLIMPNMLLQITQVLWNSALALSQFAASFNVLDEFGSTLDSGITTMVDNMLAGSIPVTLIMLAIIGVVAAAGFRVGNTGEALKRLGVSVCCVAALIVMGVGATQDAGKDTPSPGSPWWVMSTINDSVNMIAVDLSFDDLNKNGNPNMMAYSHESGTRNCQDYLTAMHEQYDAATNGQKTTADTSAVTAALNQLWEETALRSWVTMQWGNPAAGPSSSTQVAANAQQAYCHVLELQAGTDPDLQAELTDTELGTDIDSDTARWIFTTSGWIDPWNTAVNKDTDEAFDRDSATYQTRAGVFWETCGSDGENVTARPGWATLINNLTDDGSGGIRGNGGQWLRAGLDDDKLKAVEPNEDGTDKALIPGQASGATGSVPQENITKVCQAALGNEAFHNDTESAPVDSKDKHSTNLSDAAMLGWWFDVPNVNATWNEANMVAPTNADQIGVRNTLKYFYGEEISRDTLGAFGTVIGAFINGIIGALLSLVLIISKLMMLLMVLFLVFAVIVNGFPFGETPKNALKNWFKTACGLCLMGMVYAILGNIAVFICQLFVSLAASAGVSTFMYNIIAGCSLGLAMITVGMFCSKVLKIGNPFSLHAIMGMAGGAALYRGITRAGRRAAFGMVRNGWGRLSGRTRSANVGRHTSRNGNGSSSESARIQDAAAEQQETIGSTLAPIGGYAKDLKGTLLSNGGRIKDAFTGRQARQAQFAAEDRGKKYSNLRRIGHGLSTAAGVGAAGVGLVAGVGSFAAKSAITAARSKPLRDAAIRTAKVAATAGLAAAAFTNPITTPAGIALAGKALLGRDGRETIKGVTGGAVTLAKSAGQAFASSKMGTAVKDKTSQFHQEHPNSLPGKAAGAVAGTLNGMMPTPPTGANPFQSSSKPDVADAESKPNSAANPLTAGVEQPFTRMVVGPDGTPQAQLVDPLYTQDGQVSRAGGMAFDAVEDQYRSELAAKGMSEQQIEAELDKRASTGQLNRDAKAYYEQHLAPGMDMADKVNDYRPAMMPVAPTVNTEGDMRQAVKDAELAKEYQLRFNGMSSDQVKQELKNYRDSGQLWKDAQDRNQQAVNNANQQQADYQRKLEAFNHAQQRRQALNPANMKDGQTIRSLVAPGTAPAGQPPTQQHHRPSDDLEGRTFKYKGQTLTIKGGKAVDAQGKTVWVDRAFWNGNVLAKGHSDLHDESEADKAQSMGYDNPGDAGYHG